MSASDAAQLAELLARGGQLADQLAKRLVIGVAAGIGAQQRDGAVDPDSQSTKKCFDPSPRK